MAGDKRRSRLAGIGRYLNLMDGLRWWGHGLLLWLPVRWRERLSAPPPRLLIEPGSNELVISAAERGRVQELVRYPMALLDEGLPDVPRPGHRQVVLQLTTEWALVQMIHLPRAAANNLRQVVGFELDRLTPFPADKIYYDAQVIEQSLDARTLQVRFAMVLRSVLDPLLTRLRSTGLAPERVTVADDDSGCNLLPPEQRPRRTSMAGVLRSLLLLLIVTTLAAALFLPLWQLRAQVIDLLPRVDAAQRQAEEVLNLRQQLETTVESSRFLLEQRRSRPLVLDLINELTALLPDHTWVEQLEIRNGQLELRGQSREATSLLGIIEESPFFEGATFRSPITRDRRTNQDRFFLTARIVSGTEQNTP